MALLRFLHCADLHIDSPFKGIGQIHPSFHDTLYNSTYLSFSNIVDQAIAREVDFVVICGDVYDSQDKSLKAQLHFRDELSRLGSAGILAYVVYGNHDPLEGWSASLQWPDNAVIFGGDSVEQRDFQRGGITLARIYGISYKVRDVSENLALLFQHNDPDIPAVALLHTNVGGNTAHRSYAPASIEDLIGRGISYWALGHVHQRATLRDTSPVVVYPGNCQARHPRETGPKGCYLVDMESDGSCSLEFIETDLIRYESKDVDIEGLSDIDGIISQVQDVCEGAARDAKGRTVVLRLSLGGRTELHGELNRGNTLSELLESIQEQLIANSTPVLLNDIRLRSSTPYDVDELRRGNDFVADLISLYDEIDTPDSDRLVAIKIALEPLFRTWRGHRVLEELTDSQLRELAVQAMHQTLDGIVETE